MYVVRKSTVLALVSTVAVSVGAGVSGAQGAARFANATCDVGVLLPDSKSSVRWETQDRRYLDASFKAAGLTACISNAQNSAQTQTTQAQSAITNGAQVLLLVNLDSVSGATIEKNAQAKGVKVIDYDRLTLKGSASYYVSFDNVGVGKLQGQGLVACLKASGAYGKKPVIAELNGSPDDNNATLFANGYNSVLDPLYKAGTFVKGPNQSVPKWDNQKALTIFQSMLTKTSNKIDGVAAANDGLGNAVASAIAAKGLKNIPVTGQDATAQGVQNILSGAQCMTVYKAVKQEADAAAKLAISLIKKTPPAGVNSKVNDGLRDVPSALLLPVTITKKNYKILFTDKFLKKSEVCTGKFAKLCK